MRELGLGLTVLRPMAFMELMTDKAYYPPVSTWHVMPKLLGASFPVAWIAVDDVARAAAAAFAAPDLFTGRDLQLAADKRSIDECRALYAEVLGRPPRRFPMPVWAFKRVASPELVTMFRWLAETNPDLWTDTLREIVPDALTVREWLERRRDEAAR